MHTKGVPHFSLSGHGPVVFLTMLPTLGAELRVGAISGGTEYAVPISGTPQAIMAERGRNVKGDGKKLPSFLSFSSVPIYLL